MTYAISVPRRVQKQIARLPPDVQRRVDDAVRLLGDNPRPPGSRMLSARGGEWRIRVGAYRIIYAINDVDRVVLILEVWHRQRGYQ